jgi:hypothetical protein
VTKRERQRAIDRARRDVKNERQRDYYHAADGGYIVRRRRELAAERTRILDQLKQLEREAEAC